MEEKNITTEEGFAIIGQMIDKARHKLADESFYFIFWGWLIAFCATFNYVVLKTTGSTLAYVCWTFLPPVGAIVSVIYGIRQKKSKKVTTYLDAYLGYVWGAFIISLVITLAFMPIHGIKHSYFFLMILYGITSFTTGGLLRFRPLIVGSLFSFAFAALSVFLSLTDQYLCIALSLICSHIVPGHLLHRAYKLQNV